MFMEDDDFDGVMARSSKQITEHYSKDADDFELKAVDDDDDDAVENSAPTKKKSKFRVPAPEVAVPSDSSIDYWDDVEPRSPKKFRGKFDHYAAATGEKSSPGVAADAKPSRASVYAQQREHELRRRAESLRSPMMQRSARGEDLGPTANSSEYKDKYQYRDAGSGFGGEHPSPYMSHDSDLLADDFSSERRPFRQRAPRSFHGVPYYEDDRYGMPPRYYHGHGPYGYEERGWREPHTSDRSVYSDGPVHPRSRDPWDMRAMRDGVPMEDGGPPRIGYHGHYPPGPGHYDEREREPRYHHGYRRGDDHEDYGPPRQAAQKSLPDKEDKLEDDVGRKVEEDSGKTDGPGDADIEAPATNAFLEKNPSFDITAVDMSDMKAFLLKPVPKDAGVVQCYIRRNRAGTKMLFPQYVVHLKDDTHHNETFLMSAKKLAKYGTAYYAISLSSRENVRSGESYLGKVRGNNFAGTEYCIYDAGVNPRNLHADGANRQSVPARRELGVVMYSSNHSGDTGPRKMDVCIPEVSESDDTVKEWRPFHHDQEMLAQAKLRNFRNMVNLVNKPPVWNDQVEAYVLDFNGRVTMASVKNFQLVKASDPERIVLQFGRVGDAEFTMDFQWPLSPFQAFAISLSCFDTKCGQN